MREHFNRRRALQCGVGLIGGALGSVSSRAAFAAGAKRKFTMCFSGGPIGVKAPLADSITLASRHGFESVAPNARELVRMDETARAAILESMKAHNLKWGPSGVTVNIRVETDAEFGRQLKDLPATAAVLQTLGADRVKTYITPRHDTLTYLQNFKRHRDRIAAIASVLGDFGLRFGLEHVGPKHLWTSARYPFVHTQAELGELITATQKDNVGYVLDTWHWYVTSGTLDELLTLTNRDVVAVDLNDAPAGIVIDDQQDGQRELPMSTGVIDTRAFMEALLAIGYDGPVQAEPMNRALSQMDDESATAATAAALRKAFDLVDNPSSSQTERI